MIINPTARGKRSEAKILGELDALHVYELIRPGMGNWAESAGRATSSSLPSGSRHCSRAGSLNRARSTY